MIFDELSLPSDTGSTDKQDSARLAGLMTVFEWPQQVDLHNYVKIYALRYVRHPLENKYNFSRDQSICLFAGLKVQGHSHLVHKEFIDGKDIFMPSHNGHIKRCQGKEANWLEDLWLWVDVLWGCYVKPLQESNQLLCMMMIADKKYLKFWLKHNKKWRDSINLYWRDSFRNEPELAAHIINKLETFK